MKRDDDFEPKLGKPRSVGGKRGRKYLHRVLQAVAQAGGRSISSASAKRSSFSGVRIGRGASLGRVLASRDQYAAFRGRRVVVKSRFVELGGKGVDAAKAHLRYIQRDGVTREGAPGELYSADQDRADGKAFIEQAQGDRHQFRFIVAAEDGAEYEDLKLLTRRLMAQMEQDLGTKLDWVAADHFNTGHPHTHIILRGKNERGRDLIIARDYISHGIRERAAELVTLDLGPRTNLEIDNRLRQEVEQERLTSIDQALIRAADEHGMVQAAGGNSLQQSLRVGRLQKLQKLGLVNDMGSGWWQLTDDMADMLRRIGERGDIVKAIHRDLADKGVPRSPAEYLIYDPSGSGARPIIGRLVKRGLAEELEDRHYLLVDGVDGRMHYIDVGKGEGVEPVPEDAIVQIVPKRTEPRTVDRTIAAVAAANGGRYDIELHLRHDPTASATFAETHVRRLEAMRRGANLVRRLADGSWIIEPDHLERAVTYERQLAKTTPILVQVLSPFSLERQVGADGVTWLDRELVAATHVGLSDAGFGKEVRDAQSRRRQWLIEQDLAHEEEGRLILRSNLLVALQRRELSRVGAQFSNELGLPFAESVPGERIEGVYRKPVDLVSGRFAVIERSRDFTLVPWRPVLERSLGKEVSGDVRGKAVSWTINRGRSGPSIS
ncbi:MAG TPA: relaxase/mobilization nuclease RlxS [Terriglobia bacterium]|nr:relaxase/mobilization nuclease RlxS [Terriglobia bacterium]